MGTLAIPLRSLFANLGCDVVVPPRTSETALEIGVKHAPEFACLPLKITLGNLAQALEAGADTILMAGGVGPCRFGFYGELQREILKDMGYDFRMIIVDPPQGRVRHIIEAVRSFLPPVTPRQVVRACRLAWKKLNCIDKLEALANKTRAFERKPGSVSAALDRALNSIDLAETEQQVLDAYQDGVKEIKQCKVDDDRPVVKVGLVGEIYVVLEPFANHSIERKLGELGVIVDRPLNISHWLKLNVILDFLNMAGGINPGKLALPYLSHTVGGHGRETVAHTVNYAESRYDGVIQVAPFTCMPEIVAESVLHRVSRERGIPVMTIMVDEHTAEAGLITRLEAFVDMLKRRRLSGLGTTSLFDSKKSYVLS